MKVKHQPLAMTESEIEGFAHLCFPIDGTWFEGCLMTADDSQFTICGNKCDVDKADDVENICQPQNGLVVDGGQSLSLTLFDVSVFDHEQAAEYSFDRIPCQHGSHQCLISSSSIKFRAENAFKGQKATMLVQNVLPKLVDKELEVFSGIMKITVTQKQRSLVPHAPWSL